MHETARRGLVRLLGGAAGLVLLVVAVLLLVRGCRSETERLSEAVDDAREALHDRDREAFLAFFAPEVAYRGRQTRADLERDVDRWVRETRGVRVTIVDRAIAVDGDRASIDLRCDVGDVFRTYMEVKATLRAERRDGGWRVTEFDWK